MISLLTKRPISRVASQIRPSRASLHTNVSHPRANEAGSKSFYKKYEGASGAKPKSGGYESKKRQFPQKTTETSVASEPRGDSLSSKIKQLNTASDYKQAVEVWEQAKARGVEPDQFAYATYMSTCRHLEDFDGALKLYEEVLAKNIRNAFIDSQVLDVYARHTGEKYLQKAIDLFYDMLKLNLDVKLYAFNSLLKAMIADNKAGDALGMITQHGKRFAEADKNFWTTVVSTVVASGNQEAYRGLAQYILEKEVPVAQPGWLTLMRQLTLTSQEADLQLFNTIVQHLTHQGSNGLATLICYHTEMNDAAGALGVWKQLKSMPKFFSANAFTHLITVCAASGALKEVEEIYETMITSGFEPSSPVLAAMIRLYASNLRISNAQDLFDQLLAQPTYVSPFLFNSMLDMYADVNDLEAAHKILEKMKEKKMKFNVSIYNSLINLYIRAEQPEKAVEIYQTMKQNKENLNYLTYKPLLTAPGLSVSREDLLAEIKASKTISDLGKNMLRKLK